MIYERFLMHIRFSNTDYRRCSWYFNKLGEIGNEMIYWFMYYRLIKVIFAVGNDSIGIQWEGINGVILSNFKDFGQYILSINVFLTILDICSVSRGIVRLF